MGKGKDGKDVYLRDIWPSREDAANEVAKSLTPDMFRDIYSRIS